MSKNRRAREMSRISIYHATQQLRGGGAFRGSRRVIITHVPWFRRRPLIANLGGIDLQRAAMYATIVTSLIAFIQLIVSILEVSWLSLASPGARYHRYFGFSLMFVYAGNQIVRCTLCAASLCLGLLSLAVLVCNVILSRGIYLEDERLFTKWIRVMALFVVARLLAVIFQSIANDMYFAYHIVSLLFWLLASMACSVAWVIVLSNYQELSDLATLEEMYGMSDQDEDIDEREENAAQEEEINDLSLEQCQIELETLNLKSNGNNHANLSLESLGCGTCSSGKATDV